MYTRYNKSSAVAEMGNRGHNRHGPKRRGLKIRRFLQQHILRN